MLCWSKARRSRKCRCSEAFSAQLHALHQMHHCLETDTSFPLYDKCLHLWSYQLLYMLSPTPGTDQIPHLLSSKMTNARTFLQYGDEQNYATHWIIDDCKDHEGDGNDDDNNRIAFRSAFVSFGLNWFLLLAAVYLFWMTHHLRDSKYRGSRKCQALLSMIV